MSKKILRTIKTMRKFAEAKNIANNLVCKDKERFSLLDLVCYFTKGRKKHRYKVIEAIDQTLQKKFARFDGVMSYNESFSSHSLGAVAFLLQQTEELIKNPEEPQETPNGI